MISLKKAASYWESVQEMIGTLDEEELAENMWRTDCIIKGLPLDTPYVIRSDFHRMTFCERTCDYLWRKVYRKRGLIKSPSDDELIERKKAFIEDLKKKVAQEEDLDEFEKMKIGKWMKKTQEDLEDLIMNKDAPKKEIDDYDDYPLMSYG